MMITEGLAEIRTLGKRIESKQKFVSQYLARPDGMKDPFLTDGGSEEVIRRERQAIDDLEKRIVAIRRGIDEANARITITVGTRSMSVADWIIWRREVAPGRKGFLNSMRAALSRLRDEAHRKGLQVVSGQAADARPQDFVVSIDEKALAAEIEDMENTLGSLDGQLSLINATALIDIPE